MNSIGLLFSLIQFYHETDIWLFGGVFRVLRRLADRYEVELTDEGADFGGRPQASFVLSAIHARDLLSILRGTAQGHVQLLMQKRGE
jgi:hypothetical protein